MIFHSYLSSEDADWGERQVMRFRWILILAILILIGYIFIAGETERGIISLSLAMVYVAYNSIINLLLRRFKGAVWIRYVSSIIDITVLSAHIFNYSYFFTPIAVSTAPSLFVYAIFIVLSVLRYDGRLVIFTTAYVVLCSNVIYFIRYPDIDPYLFQEVASAGPEGAFYRSVYFILMGYFIYSVPKMINRLVEKQNAVSKERREIEIKLALETQRKEMAMYNLASEQGLTKQLNDQKLLILEQNKKLEKLMATKDKLFSIIGHDLRTPFCTQSSLSEYVLHDFNDIEKDSLIEIIQSMHKTANDGLDMLTNLMDWNLAESNTLQPEPEDVRIKPLIERVVERQADAWVTKDIKIDHQIADDVNAYADEQMLESVLRNLISNAIKFTPDTGVVQIKANMHDDDCVIEIIDSGVGMNQTQLDELFLLNKSVSSLGTNNEKGNGLGLVLSKEIIDKNNGSINVKSNPGKGTHFQIALPVIVN